MSAAYSTAALFNYLKERGMLVAVTPEPCLFHSDDPCAASGTLPANEPDDFKAWLFLGIDWLGKAAVIERLLDWMDPILTTAEADRLVGWHLGVSL